MQELIIARYQLYLLTSNKSHVISEEFKELAYKELLKINLQISGLELVNELKNNPLSSRGKIQGQVHLN